MFVQIKANKNSLAQRKPLYGVAINDSWYITRPLIDGKEEYCPFYRAWKSMLERCLCPKFHNRSPSYVGCGVFGEWLTFSVFRKWMVEQDWEGNVLDKDILVSGNKIYSPKTCIFVSQHVNTLLNSQSARRGKYPLGVSLHKRDRTYRSQININGKLKILGCYGTPKEAETVYKAAKKAEIIRVANEQDNQKVKDALIRIANSRFG